MKKLFCILSVVIMLLGSILFMFSDGNVKAEDISYEKEWESESVNQYDPRVVDNTKNFEYKDGYLFADAKGLILYSDYGDTELAYYDKDGKLIKKNSFSQVSRLVVKNDNIFIFDRDIPEKGSTVYKVSLLDENLAISKTKEIDSKTFEDLSYKNVYNYEKEGIETVTVDGESLILLAPQKIIKMSFDLETISELERNNENLEKYFPLIHIKENETASIINHYNSYASDEDKIVKAGYYYEEEDSVDKNALLEVSDGEKVLFKEESTEYKEFTDASIVENKVFVTATYNVGEGYASTKSDILVYNLEGELLDKIKSNSKYKTITETGDGFVTTRFYVEGTCDYKTGGDVEGWIEDSCKTYIFHEKFALVKSEVFVPSTPNPETLVASILGLLLLLGISTYVYKVSKKKVSYYN